MTDQQDPRKERYTRAREALEDLEIEDRTVFLIQETVNTITAGVDSLLRRMSEDLEGLFEERKEAGAEEEAPPAKEPPRKKTSTTRKTTAKKSTAKQSTASKTTGRKTKKNDGA